MPNGSGRLAAEGGRKTRTSQFPPWPVFDEEMIEAAGAVLRSGKVNYWTGQESRKFEREFADFVGTTHAIAVANGTVAIELALEALGVGTGDEVVVPCRTFIATASAVAMRGATPVMADVDIHSQNMTAACVEPLITERTKAIIPVHLAGLPCDMDPIMDLASRRKLWVIEDCAQAHGANYHGRQVGSIGHFGAFSFCQDKILSTGGEGGMVTTNDERLWKHAWSFKDHGKDWDVVQTPMPGKVFKWLHNSMGTNWRITEMQSAIGRVLLRRLPEWVATRRKNANTLHQRLADIEGVTSFQPPQGFYHSYYKFYAQIDTSRLRDDWTRDKIVLALQAEGIPCGSGICPEIYREGALANTGLAPQERLPNALQLSDSSLMFQVHPTVTGDDLTQVVQGVKKVLQHALSN